MFTRAQLDAEAPIWILHLSYAGRSLIYGSEALALADAAGLPLPAIPYLSASAHEETLGLFEAEPRIPEITVDVVPPHDLDLALLHRRGIELVGSRAEWSCVYPGQTWDERIRLLAGEVYSATFGAAGESATISIRGADVIDRGRLLDPTARVNADTYPSAGASAEGAVYPLVFGQPGPYSHPDGTTGNTSGSPALLVESARILIAGHATQSGRDGSTVRIFASDDTSEAFTAEHTTDGLGRLVSTVDVSGAATLTVSGDLEYWARWDNGGGLIAPDGGSAGRAGQLIRALMRASSLRGNAAAITSAAIGLDRYQLAGYVNDPEASPLGWILDNLIPLLPVSSAPTADGLAWISWPLDGGAERAVADLQVGPDLQRVGRVQIEGRDQILNAPTLEYALRARTGAYQASATISPIVRAPETALTADEVEILGVTVPISSVAGYSIPSSPISEVRSGYAEISAGRYGIRAESTSTDIVYESDTAVRILRDRVRIRAFTRTRIRYEAHPRYAHLRAGDVVTITDAEMHLADQIATVAARRWAEGSVTLDLLLVSDPIRDAQP